MPQSAEKYLTIHYSKTYPNTLTLKIDGETHTLGNLLAEKILKDPRCTFSAYKVSHPLKEEMELRVSASGSTPVLNMIKENLKELEEDLAGLISQAKEERNVE